jgi:hypothetical protein
MAKQYVTEPNALQILGSRTAGNMIELENGRQGLAVYSIYNASHDSDVFYNTMITIDIEDPADVPEGQTLNATRIVPQLFYVCLEARLITTNIADGDQGNENLYGSFCTYRSGASGSKHEPSDSHLYLFSTASSGIKVARVPLAHKTGTHHELPTSSSIKSPDAHPQIAHSTNTGPAPAGPQPSLPSPTPSPQS